MQEGTVETYQILEKSWNYTKGLKIELATGLPFFQGQLWDFTGNLGKMLPCYCFLQSTVFNSWDVWISFREHLDHPNYPRLFQTKEDNNNNEEAQSWVPGNRAGVAAFYHNKKKQKSLKPLNGIFCSSQSPLHMYQWKSSPSKYTQELMEILLWPNDAERNWQWDLTRSLQGTETSVKYAHSPHGQRGEG